MKKSRNSTKSMGKNMNNREFPRISTENPWKCQISKKNIKSYNCNHKLIIKSTLKNNPGIQEWPGLRFQYYLIYTCTLVLILELFRVNRSSTTSIATTMMTTITATTTTTTTTSTTMPSRRTLLRFINWYNL